MLEITVDEKVERRIDLFLEERAAINDKLDNCPHNMENTRPKALYRSLQTKANKDEIMALDQNKCNK